MVALMIGTILSWLVGGGIKAIGSELRQARLDQLNAANDSERIAADLRVKELEAQQSIILAAQGDRFERWIRIGFALPFLIYLNKLVLWDKVLRLGTTDPLSPMLTEAMWVVLGGFFVLSTARIVKGR
jgi:hypothetical protein